MLLLPPAGSSWYGFFLQRPRGAVPLCLTLFFTAFRAGRALICGWSRRNCSASKETALPFLVLFFLSSVLLLLTFKSATFKYCFCFFYGVERGTVWTGALERLQLKWRRKCGSYEGFLLKMYPHFLLLSPQPTVTCEWVLSSCKDFDEETLIKSC